MKKIIFITPADAHPGFALAGVTHYASSSDDAEALLKKVMADPDTGVAVIDERLAMTIEEDRFREMERRWFGILLVLPSPGGAGGEAAEDYARRLIRKAIGYHVRVRI
jgi:V/A-type H+-transporting ATPase subunit F